jgi:hypothetical protein
MRHRLGPYRAEMQDAREDPDDIVGQGCLLWRIIYGFVAREARGDGQALLVRHEDLSSDPLRRYEELYDRLGLDLNEAARRTIVPVHQRGEPGRSLTPALRKRSCSTVAQASTHGGAD